MNLSAKNEITPIKAAEDKAAALWESLKPWAMVGVIVWLIFKGGRYGA